MDFAYDDQNIFAKILRGEIPNTTVYENDHALAFRDLYPQAPVHVLVIPKKKIQGFSNLKGQSAIETGEYINRVSLVAEKLGLESGGYRVVFNNGSDGGQTVDYIHAHILGGRGLSWPPG